MIGRFSKQTQKLSKKKQEDSAVILSEDATSNIELRKLRLVFEQTPSAIFILDKDFRFEYVNPGYERLSGFSEAELIGQPLTNIFNQSEFTEPREEILKSILSGQKWEGEMGTYKKDNSTYWTTVVASPFRDETGNIEGYIIIQQDISDRKKMEQALQISEKRYRNLIQSLQEGLFVIQNGKFVFLNNSIVDIVGYTVEELTGMSFLKVISPEYKQIVAESHQLRVEGKTSPDSYEVKLIKKDGITEVPVILSVTVTEYQGEWALLGTAKDITERKAIEQSLQESEKKYRELAEMLPQTVFEIDQKGYLRYLNKNGVSKFGEDFHSICVFDLVVPEDIKRMKQNFADVSINRNPAKGNVYTLIDKNRQTFPAMISASPMAIEGKPDGSRGVVIDLSDHIAMQKALAESEEKYRLLIENATDGIVIAQDGLMRFYNQAMADMLQIEGNKNTDIPFLDKVLPEDHQRMTDFHNRRMKGEDFVALYRSRMIRKDGKIIIVELNARTSNYNGRPAAFIVIRNITDRVKIEEELQIAKNELEKLNSHLEKRVKESSKRLTEAKTQLINLQKENLQSQYDVLKQQVNPHFLFNSLNVLTSLIKLEPDLAEKFSEQLSKVYRYVLENKDNELVDLNTELNFLDAYIFLLNIRFVGKLVVKLNIPEENKNDRIIPLAMQLLIENAIKHNVMSKNNPLIIDIFIDERNHLNIINNLQERPSQIISTGVGLKNILNRYQLLGLEVPVFEKTEKQFIAKIQLVKSI